MKKTKKTKKTRKGHETVEMVIKKANVDKGVRNIIKWLNSYANIITNWSCEGDSFGNTPYVVFTCGQYDLSNVLQTIDDWNKRPIRKFVTIEVSFYEEGYSPIRYAMYFHDVKSVRSFERYIRTHVLSKSKAKNKK